jgi:hypothetical protein
MTHWILIIVLVVVLGLVAVGLFIVTWVYDDYRISTTERRRRQLELQHRQFHNRPTMAPPFTIIDERQPVDWATNRWLDDD